MSSPNDEELINLIARCAINDQAALKRLVFLVGPYLNAVVFRIIQSNETTQDVLQEAFLQIWRNANTYRSHLARPLTWMASIARYRALDRLDSERQLNSRYIPIDQISAIEEPVDDNTPEQQIGRLQQHRQLNRCLELLSETIKRSIELAYLYGYSREEIAVQLSTNTNTVKSWLHRGAERLKSCLTTN